MNFYKLIAIFWWIIILNLFLKYSPSSQFWHAHFIAPPCFSFENKTVSDQIVGIGPTYMNILKNKRFLFLRKWPAAAITSLFNSCICCSCLSDNLRFQNVVDKQLVFIPSKHSFRGFCLHHCWCLDKKYAQRCKVSNKMTGKKSRFWVFLFNFVF